MFPILGHDQLMANLANFDAIRYCRTRNYLDGGVSKLSPYITHGILTIDEIVQQSLLSWPIDKAEMRYKELLWREYFVQVHYWQGDAILADIEEDKTHIPKKYILPQKIKSKTFDASRVNQCIVQLETSGYLHNHQRMRLASYLVHYYRLHRRKCADWTYYHFLDGELGPNHLSWQWVQSTFSHKPYYMNEENLMRYSSYTDATYRGTYQEIEAMLFDLKREVNYQSDSDIADTLITDLSTIPHADGSYDGYTILSPRDLHPSKIQTSNKTICILDRQFLKQHPRSDKRIAFVQQYCALYGIGLVQGDIKTILSNATDIVIYQTWNPCYKQAYDAVRHKPSTTYHQHKRCSPIVAQGYTKKFFPFWEKTKPYLVQKG